MINRPQEFTHGYYRRRLSWETIFKFVSDNIMYINGDMVKRAFNCCGVIKNWLYNDINILDLNVKLQTIIGKTDIQSFSFVEEDSESLNNMVEIVDE